MNYEPILKMFCHKHPRPGDRFDVADIFTVGDWTAATDGEQMACIPSRLFSVPWRERTPNVQALFDWATYKMPIEIAVKQLYSRSIENDLAKLPVQPKEPKRVFGRCSTCNGSRNCFCDCRGAHHCMSCGGSGERETDQSKRRWEAYGNALLDYRNRKAEIPAVWFCDAAFDYRFLKNVREACKKLKAKTLVIEAYSPKGPLIATAGDMKFAIMPMLCDKAKCVELIKTPKTVSV